MERSITPVSLEPPVETVEATDFESFFLRERPRVLGSMVLIVGNVLDADEIVQEAFFRVWERWDRVHRMDDPTGYLFRTALNVQRSAYRRALRAARRTVARHDEPDPFVTVAARDDVLRALGAMTPRQRAAVVLTELHGFSTEEAASIMGIRPGTVHVLISQGRKALRADAGATDA
jgi:RNA polymerase sigma factor (sigma-70 family)